MRSKRKNKTKKKNPPLFLTFPPPIFNFPPSLLHFSFFSSKFSSLLPFFLTSVFPVGQQEFLGQKSPPVTPLGTTETERFKIFSQFVSLLYENVFYKSFMCSYRYSTRGSPFNFVVPRSKGRARFRPILSTILPFITGTLCQMRSKIFAI